MLKILGTIGLLSDRTTPAIFDVVPGEASHFPFPFWCSGLAAFCPLSRYEHAPERSDPLLGSPGGSLDIT